MDKLMLHIEKLLVNHDYAVVPGLGGFVVQAVPSSIQANFISSPGVSIGFNSMIKQEDGLLALSVSRELGISYREAASLIRNEVIEFKSLLNEKSKITFGNLGFFSLDENAKIQFEPAKQNYFLPGNLGQTQVKISKKSHIEIKTIALSNSYMKYAAILIMALGLFFTSNKLNQGNKVNSADLMNIELIKTELNKQPEVKVDEIQKTFHIVVAAFYSQKVADKYCEQLKSSNFSNAKVISGKKNFKIIVDSYSSNEEAVVAMKQFRKSNKDFAEAWILRN